MKDRCCDVLLSVKAGGYGKIKSSIEVEHRFTTKIRGKSDLKFQSNREVSPFVLFNAKGSVKEELLNIKTLFLNFSSKGKIKDLPVVDKNLSTNVSGKGKARGGIDKFFGEFVDNSDYGKMYPKSDLYVSNLKASGGETIRLFDNIDEGIFYGDYHTHGKYSDIFFNDEDYIITDKRRSEAVFEVDKPLQTFRDSYITLRAASNSSFKIHGLELEDSLGRTICAYPDIIVSGDNEFTTYSFKADPNFAALNTYENGYIDVIDVPQLAAPSVISPYDNLESYSFEAPVLDHKQVFKVKFKVSVNNSENYSSFNDFFDDDFDDSDFGFRYLKISSLEIFNKVDGGIREEGYIPLYLTAPDKGMRLATCISPILRENDIFLFDISKKMCGEFPSGGPYNKDYSKSFWTKKGCDNKNIWFNAEQVYLKAYFNRAGVFSAELSVNDGLLNNKLSIGAVSTSAKEGLNYIPLDLNLDNKSRPSFGKLFLEIDLEQEMSIEKVEICISHGPSNAIKLETLGGDLHRICRDDEVELLTSQRINNNDLFINKGSEFSRVSLIENIPHGYSNPDTLRTNYARRWVGSPGNVKISPFKPSQFDFSFQFEQPPSPFLIGHYTFSATSGDYILPKVGDPLFYNKMEDNPPLRNLGLRTKIKDRLGNSVHLYDSIDWSPNVNQYSVTDSFDGTLLPINKFDENPIGQITEGDIVLPQEFSDAAMFGFSLYMKFSLPQFDFDTPPSLNLNRDLIFGMIKGGNVSSTGPLWVDIANQQIGFYHNFGANTQNIATSIDFSKQFPIHIILKHDEDRRFRFYWMYDGEGIIYNQVATGNPSPLNFDPSEDQFIIRTGNIILHELGISYNNLIEGSELYPDLYQESIERFLQGKIMHWDQPNDYPEDDNNYLPSFINTKISDWHMGAFKFAHFNNAQFDIMTKRPSKEFLSFDIYGSGSPYGNHLSYNSQIENDFLRFNTEDPDDKVFGVPQRISKDIMDNYVFNKRGIVAETIIDYSQEGEIIWADGKLGPKMIVTLFSDDLGVGESGIINRKQFYLDPYISWEKLECTFDPDQYWGYNKPDIFLEEFTDRIQKQHMDSMFIQYDLEIPNSDFYRSKINIHAANVTLECPLFNASEYFSSLNVYTSGEYVRYGFVDFDTIGGIPISGDILLRSFASDFQPSSGNINLLCSGDFIEYGLMPLLLPVGSGVEEESDLNLYMNAAFVSDAVFNLHTYYDYDIFPQDKFLGLYSFSTEYDSARKQLNLVSFNTFAQKPDNIASLNLLMTSIPIIESSEINDSFNLHTLAPKTPSDRLNLFLEGRDKTHPISSDFVNLHVISYPLVFLGNFGKIYFAWTVQDIGRGVQAFDENLLSIPSTDKIRDQEGICYGECGCVDEKLRTHSINWYGDSCETGGLARPFRFTDYEQIITSGATFDNSLITFDNTNLTFDSTSVESGVSSIKGFFYGARKYTGLIPNSKYSVRFSAITGSTDPIELPREFEEWEYGSLNNNDYISKDIDYIPNYIITSGDTKVVKTMDNKLFTSYPQAKLFEDREIENAGLISLFERTDLIGSGDKSSFEFKENIMLPEGMRGDFYYELPGKFIAGYGEIPVRKWNIGQEGREFGHSMDVGKNGDREILVVGAPKAQWNREFEEIATSGINVALMVFTDEYDNFSYSSSLDEVNLLLKYFAANPTHINLKPIIYHPVGITELSEFNTGFMTRKALPRNILNRPTDSSVIQESAQIIREGIDELFPYDAGERNNNLPAIILAYVDNSRSLGRKVIEPALTQFTNSFKAYSLASGVQDIFGNPRESFIVEKILPRDVGENHGEIATQFIDEVLSTGNLFNTGMFSLFTSGIGPQFVNSENVEFNIPPNKGGRVYIFEKEFEDWNLVQEIKESDREFDMFGHAVAISEDTYTIAIGSPHASENCAIFKYKPEAKQAVYGSVGRWLKENNRSEYNQYLEIMQVSGVFEAGKEIYKGLSKKDRFYVRSDEKVWGNNKLEEFTKVHSDGVDGIGGEFTEIATSGAGNPRLGYSAAVNENGSIVAFGAPTDSFGLYTNADFYFRHDGYYDPDNPDFELIPSGTWNSYVHAGSVRIYEQARKTFPTANKSNLPGAVLEYGRFGNLSRSLGFTSFDQQGNEINSTAIAKNENYTETGFDEFRIPDETAALFIITPEVDATNDQVMNEIRRWMSLGDRRLVLVGDDPIWEENGVYAKSNEIINKILDKLDSRMRLFSARNSREALMENNNYEEDSFATNVIKSFKPEGSRDTEIKHDSPLHGYGTADIKFFSPETVFTAYSEYTLQNNLKKSICSYYNKSCNLPIAHLGDLRAEWTEKGLRYPPTENEARKYVYWKRNLGFEYGSQGFPQISDEDRAELEKSRNIKIPGAEPSPLMVAATFEEKTLFIPGLPPTSSEIPITEQVCYPKNTKLFFFNENALEEDWLEWSSEKQDYDEIDYNYYIIPPEGIEPLFDPERLYDRDAVLQGKYINFEGNKNTSAELVILDPYSTVVARQDINSSTVYLIASTSMEEKFMLAGEDQNISFYDNLVRFSSNASSNIVQLGGWTGANSFKTFVKDSRILAVLNSRGHFVIEGGNLTSASNVAWIPNTPNLPSQSQADQIINWLNSGNKRLVITYDGTAEKARNIRDLCDMLNLKIRPWQLPDNAMARNIDKTDKNLKLSVSRETYPQNEDDWVNKISFEIDFIPIQIQEGMKILYQDAPVTFLSQTLGQEPDVLKMRTGVLWSRFPGIPGSGYEVTYRWYSDFPNEDRPLDLFIANVVLDPDDPEEVESRNIYSIVNYNNNNEEQGVAKASYKDTLVSFGVDILYEKTVKVQLDNNHDYLDFFITGNRKDKLISTDNPHTCKLLDIVIKPLPINMVISSKSECFDEIVGYDTVFNPGTDDETIILPPKLYPFSSDDTDLCLCPKGSIDDGPVMIAEELETFSDFTSGSRRSSIVLIADSTLVNGRNPRQDNGQQNNYAGPTINTQNMNGRINNFITSLTENRSDDLPNIDYQPHIRLVSPEIMGGIYGVGIGGGSTNNDPTQHVTHYDYKEQFIIPHAWAEDTKEEAVERVKQEFDAHVGAMGINPKFKFGQYEDIPYSGVGIMVHKLMEEEGKDFIDKEFMFDKYLGDLFGYSVSINKNRVFVGTPSDGWKNGNIDVDSEGGGGGAVFAIDRHPTSGWMVTEKLKPDSVNPTDRFGYSISSMSDLLIVGSPAHDYITEVDYVLGQYVRKEFTSQFEIGTRETFDNDNSFSEDIGAVYTYQNKLVDFNNRIKEWKFIEKVTPPSGEFFGENIHLFRNYRSDSDYSLASNVDNDGINVYVYDAMIRRQPPSLVSPNAQFNATIFGSYKDKNSLTISLDNLSEFNSEKIETTGEVYSDQFGQILLEVSGVDTSRFGFMAQRPYVNFVFGEVHRADQIDQSLDLSVEGGPIYHSDNINLFALGPDSHEVYNNLELFIKGNQKSGDLNLSILDCHGFEGINNNDLLFHTDAIGIIEESLNFRARGK